MKHGLDSTRACARHLLALVCLLAPDRAPLQAQGDVPAPVRALAFDERARGPLELRDEHVLSQPRSSLPAIAPDVLPRGRTTWRWAMSVANSFAWAQDVPGEQPAQRRYLLDAETATLDMQLTRGLGAHLDVTLRVPWQVRGGGLLDRLIDAFHRGFAFTGIEDGGRPAFRRDAFRVEGRTTAGARFEWRAGNALGDVEVALRAQLAGHRTRTGQSRGALAWVLRLRLPSAQRPFAGQGVALGLQGVGRWHARPSLHLYAGLGVSAGGARQVLGVGYTRWRPAAFVAAERPLGRNTSLLIQSDVAGRLARDVDGLPGGHWVVHVGVVRQLTPRAALTLGLTENLKPQAVTADVALHAALTLRR